MIKIFIAEDHNIVRDGIKSILEQEPGIKVVEVANNGLEAIQKISTGIDAEIILTNLHLPENGLSLLQEMQKISADKKVLFLSTLENLNYVQDAINAGAWGYLLKNVSSQELIFAIRHVASGGKYISSEIALKIISKNPGSRSNFKKDVDLSRREAEVLALIAEGFTNNEIANKLFTSRRTIEGHRQNLLEKTGARNTAALIRLAVQNGLVA